MSQAPNDLIIIGLGMNEFLKREKVRVSSVEMLIFYFPTNTLLRDYWSLQSVG